MAIEISQHLKDIINRPESFKVLATVSNDGIPHVVFKGSIFVNEDGLIEYNEVIESSQTNKNLVSSIWFNRTVAINVLFEKESFQIKGKVDRAIIAGHEFEERYKTLLEKRNADLSTIWRIIPEEIREESFKTRLTEETAAHPILQHLDRLTK